MQIFPHTPLLSIMYKIVCALLQGDVMAEENRLKEHENRNISPRSGYYLIKVNIGFRINLIRKEESH